MGCSEEPICFLVDGTNTNIGIHIDVLEPWKVLCQEAAKEGFELSIVSGYRNFERQLWIWNAKLTGLRPVLDDNSCELDLSSMTSLERVERVLRWSALPGASRHHWGTDMDIYDKAAIEKDYSLQLVPDEYQGDGPFAPMVDWLKHYLAKQVMPGFYFPFCSDKGGVMPEPWHLSYHPVAERYQKQWTLDKLVALLSEHEIAEKEAIAENIDYIYQRYIRTAIFPPT
ncbi:MAG: M15 family metallopeptidase [Cellvibrionaceae bacterium]